MHKAIHLKRVDSSDYYDTEEAAKSLSIQPAAIRNYLYKGILKTYKFKRLTLIKVEEIERWRIKQRKH